MEFACGRKNNFAYRISLWGMGILTSNWLKTWSMIIRKICEMGVGKQVVLAASSCFPNG